jgi:quercetin dioxygenase-like cupin family protein
MANSSYHTHQNSLRAVNRYITTHDESGKAIFSTSISPDAPTRPSTGGAMDFMLLYTTTSFPVKMNGDKDIQNYKHSVSNPPAISISGGTVLRTVDFAPGYTSPMHRTVTCDFGVVLEGEVELILDSGEKRILKRGDVTVQRGTNHAWRNVSKDKWARMMYVLQAAEPVEINNTPLAEDENGID